MIAGRFFVTPHAVRQYRDRHRRGEGLSFDQALEELIRLSDQARYVKPMDTDAELWRLPGRKKIRLVVRPGEGKKPSIVTVLPHRRKSDA